MPIDAYSLCPGGTGQKIKFCCNDLLGDLQKLDKMLEGGQNQACLNHIDSLRKDNPDRACLLAIKCMVLRATGNLDEAKVAAEEFVEKHPENPTALAEAACATAASEGGRAALKLVHRALAASEGGIQSPAYEALGTVAQVLLFEGEYLAGRALLQLQIAISEHDDRPVQLMIEVNRSPQVSLLLKDDPPMSPGVEDAAIKEGFDEAMDKVKKGDWQGAADRLAELAPRAGGSPEIWRNLAMLRGWLADREGQIEALRKFATLDVPYEDACEAEALAMQCEEDPLGDMVDVLLVTYTVEDVEKLQAAMGLESRVVQVPVDPSMHQGDEDSPPPRASYLLLDRPSPAAGEDLNIKTVSRILGRAMLFGRQTDRQAHLDVLGVTEAKVPAVEKMLNEIADGALLPDPEQEVMARASASRMLFQRNWQLTPGTTPQQVDQLAADDLHEAVMVRWPELKLGILDGKSPSEAAGDEANRVKLAAAVMVLESWTQVPAGAFDFNRLRDQLGLPALEPIDPSQVQVDRLPLVRLSRVMAEKTTDEQLIMCYRRAVAFGAAEAVKKFARAVLDRDSLPPGEEQVRAHSILAQTATDPDEALQHIAAGCQAAKAANQSDAVLNLMELSLRAARGEFNELTSLVRHIEGTHIEEPGVADSLTQFLIRIGALNPDGTPAAPPPGPMPGEMPSAEAAPEPGKLWTPDGGEPGGEEKKLWTPD